MPLHHEWAYYGQCTGIWGGENVRLRQEKVLFEKKWTTTASNDAHHFEGHVVWLVRIERIQHTLQNIHGIPR
jgi:hypothetical protein